MCLVFLLQALALINRSIDRLTGCCLVEQILYLHTYITVEGKARAKIGNNTKLLEQPIPASFLKLEKRIRELAVQCRNEDRPTLLRETVFK